MSEPIPSRTGSRWRKLLHLGFSGIAVLAGIGTVVLCFSDLQAGSALGRNGTARFR